MGGETCFELLRQLHGQGQEVLVFHLLTPEELELPYEGDFIMEDSETRRGDSDRERKDFARSIGGG